MFKNTIRSGISCCRYFTLSRMKYASDWNYNVARNFQKRVTNKPFCKFYTTQSKPQHQHNEDEAEKKHPVVKPDYVKTFYDRFIFSEPPDLIVENEHDQVISKVNKIMEDPGRLFAIVVVSGEQYKVTTNDLINVYGYIQAECGSRIRLEKVVMVGGTDFTLIGKPVIKRSLVKIEATVIEKTPSVDMIVKRFIRRKRHETTHRFNSLHTVLRINSIEVFSNLQ